MEKHISKRKIFQMYFDLTTSRPVIMIVIFFQVETNIKSYIAFIVISLSYAFKLFWGRLAYLAHIQVQKSKVACIKRDY